MCAEIQIIECFHSSQVQLRLLYGHYNCGVPLAAKIQIAPWQVLQSVLHLLGHHFFTECQVMATFLWLSVISFDVWRRFAMRKFQVFYKNKRSSFFNYNIIVWSSAGLLTCIIFLVDQFVETNLDNPYNPAVEVFSCWIFSKLKNCLLYFLIMSILNYFQPMDGPQRFISTPHWQS